jgi:CRISPR-associated protein Cas1
MLFRATSGLKRLVVIGRAGAISLAALGWLRDVGALFVHLDYDGEPLAVSEVRGLDDPRLRRLQALAAGTAIGLRITKELVLRPKLEGQRGVIASADPSAEALDAVDRALGALEESQSIQQAMGAEANAALTYWSALASIPMVFARKDLPRIPSSWLTLGQRGSPLTASPRRAVTPGQAIVNLLYGLGEAEARLACAKVGLDSGLGVLHVDLKSRDSLALDILEVARPSIDAYVIELLRTHTFAARDFREDRQGQVWVMPSLARSLAETAPIWGRELGAVAERVGRMLAAQPRSRIGQIPTPITENNRSDAQAVKRVGPRTQPKVRVSVPSACRSCGLVLEDAARGYCGECLKDVRAGQGADLAMRGPAAVARLRSAGDDPAKRPESQNKVGAANARRAAEHLAWEAEHDRPDPDIFRREILPAIRDIPLRRLAKATGLSLQYVGKVRRGLFVPHPRHWQGFRASVASAAQVKG